LAETFSGRGSSPSFSDHTTRPTQGLALLAQGVGAFYAPHEGEWQQLEVVPVPIKSAESRGRSLPRFIRLPSGSTMLCSGTPSKACQKILEKTQSSFPDDEGWAYGDGFYSMGWPDLDDNADTGIIGMPYDFDNDLLGSHIAAVSGVEPCGGCPGE
jgi:hypothetical protein